MDEPIFFFFLYLKCTSATTTSSSDEDILKTDYFPIALSFIFNFFDENIKTTQLKLQSRYRRQ